MTLFINGNNYFGGYNLGFAYKELDNLKNLRHLRIIHTNFELAQMTYTFLQSGLKNATLESLNLGYRDCSGLSLYSIIESVYSMKSLKKLDLDLSRGSNYVAEEVVAAGKMLTASSIKELKINLDYEDVSDQMKPHFEKFKSVIQANPAFSVQPQFTYKIYVVVKKALVQVRDDEDDGDEGLYMGGKRRLGNQRRMMGAVEQEESEGSDDGDDEDEDDGK